MSTPNTPAGDAAGTAAKTASAPGPAAAPRRARRAPAPGDRQRDATRTRQRILDAALAEFADKGYAGARVREIAQRAGVNTQLISYYFGGKDGLYNELVASWNQQQGAIEQENVSFADLAVGYVHAFAARPELLRMFAWEGLAPHADRPPDDTWRDQGEPPELTDLRRRQASGEIAADLDPAFLLVFLSGAAMATVTIPQQIERLCGIRADSEEYTTRAAEQVRLLIAHFAGPGEQ
jgi:AcrR family transcriptional regulator